MEYKVSIIVPVYNAEKYLDKCIESVINQTLDSFELILLDDGSNDRSGLICDKYATKYNNVSVFHLQNGGVSKARNIGIANAKGEYIGFVDSDDYIDSKMYESLYSNSKNNDADIVMCSYFIDNGKTLAPYNMNYKDMYSGEKQIKSLMLRYSEQDHNGLFSVWNKMIKRSLIVDNQLEFDENLVRAEDAWFVFDCLKYTNKFCFVDEKYYYYRQVESSAMHTIQTDRFERTKDFRKKLQSENENLRIDYDKNRFFYEFLYENFTYCRFMLKTKNKSAVITVLNDQYFKNACKYNKCLPPHLKLLCVFENLNLKNLVLFLLKLWSIK